MKIVSLVVFAAIMTALVSFREAGKVTAPHQVTYEVDKDASVLGWKGGKGADYFHTGTVKFSTGKAQIEHGTFVNGEFVVDLNSIAVNDAGMPKEKQDGLAKHLKNEDFFNVMKYATARVTVSSFKDGKFTTTINVLGVDVKQDIPVTVTTEGSNIIVKGKFDVDFTAANIPGTAKHEGDKESISPVFTFDLNLVLKAQK